MYITLWLKILLPMNTILKIAPIILLGIALSCNCQKEAINENTSKRTYASSEETMKVKNTVEEYTNGTIISGGKSACEYLIKLEDGSLFDPINLEDKFKKEELEVQFTFARLRMRNRCDNASPINIIDIKEREE